MVSIVVTHVSSNKTLEVSLPPDTPVLRLKEMVASAGIGEVARQHLIIHGEKMANDKPLCHYFRSTDTAGPQKVYLALKPLPRSSLTTSSLSASASSPRLNAAGGLSPSASASASASASSGLGIDQESAFSPRSRSMAAAASFPPRAPLASPSSASPSASPSASNEQSSSSSASAFSSSRSEMRQRHQAQAASSNMRGSPPLPSEEKKDAAAAAARSPPPDAPAAAASQERVCRLCFSSEVTPETGRLFSPCRCSGSMRYIHLACLNQWRKRSPKASSYFQCDQCQYMYNVRRTFIAEKLQSPHTTAVLTVLCLLTTIFVLGAAALYFSLFHRFLDWLYKAINWTPEYFWGRYLAPKLGASPLIIPMSYKAFVDTFFLGTVFVSTVGMCRYFLLQFGFIFLDGVDMRFLAAPLIGVMQIYYLGGNGIRLLLIIGVAHSVLTLFWLLQNLIKSAPQQFSEDILDISEAAQGARSRVRAR